MIKKPKALKQGDTIALVAPARPASPDELTIITKALQQQNFKVKLSHNLTHRHGYLAGKDSDRAAGIMEAWCDPSVNMVWCIGGGYGSSRLLELLDFKKMREHPKIFVGMSDVTALHCALSKELQIITYLGPMPQKLFCSSGEEQALRFAENHLWQTLKGNRHLPSSPHAFQIAPYTIQQGIAQGKLVGGNLALICSLIGTPWQLDTKDKILLLEDINEEPYKVDRMLRQLKYCGLLSSPAGVILATWEKCSTKQSTLSLEQIFNDYFLDSPYPVFAGYPSGHIDGQLTLPLNALVEINASEKQLILLESPVNYPIPN